MYNNQPVRTCSTWVKVIFLNTFDIYIVSCRAFFFLLFIFFQHFLYCTVLHAAWLCIISIVYVNIEYLLENLILTENWSDFYMYYRVHIMFLVLFLCITLQNSMVHFLLKHHCDLFSFKLMQIFLYISTITVPSLNSLLQNQGFITLQ